MKKIIAWSTTFCLQISFSYCEQRGHIDESEYSDSPGSTFSLQEEWIIFGIAVVAFLIYAICQNEKDPLHRAALEQ
jgi:hypothetical protein